MKRPPDPDEDRAFVRVAINLARRHSLLAAGGPFGSIVVKSGRVVGRGWNKVTSANDPTAHAEIVAIRSACRKLNDFSLKGCTLYASCEPCPMCLAAAYWARVDRVVYAANRKDAARIGFDDARLYREIGRPPGTGELAMEQVLRDEAVTVMKEWLARPDRTVY